MSSKAAFSATETRVRVNVQLIDAETGSHLWAERFDKPLADLFDMQDEIVARLAARWTPNSPPPRRDGRNKRRTPTRWTSIFRVWPGQQGSDSDNVAQARSFFDRALAADPEQCRRAHWIGGRGSISGRKLFCDRPVAAFAAAEAKLTKALSSVPDHARAHMHLGLVQILTRRAAEGIAECEHALALDRNLADAHPSSDLVRLSSVAPRKRRLTLPRPCGSVRAIRWLHLDDHRGPREATSAVGSRRSRGFAVDRGQSKFSVSIFLVGRRPRAAWSPTRRVPQSRPVSRSTRAYTVSRAPRRLDGEERRSDVSGPPRAHFRRHAQGRGPRAMTAARRLAAILAADVVGYSRLMGQDEAGTARAVREGHEASTPIVAEPRRPHRQDDGRRRADGVSLCGRRRRMRDRDPEADD